MNDVITGARSDVPLMLRSGRRGRWIGIAVTVAVLLIVAGTV